MAGATVTTAAAAIKPTFEPGLRKTFYEGTPLISMFPRQKNTGGNTLKWKVHYAGNTSGTAYSEGATPPAAGYRTLVHGTEAVFDRITGTECNTVPASRAALWPGDSDLLGTSLKHARRADLDTRATADARR